MKRASLLISLVLALLAASIAAAQSGGNYDLTWNTVDGGGGPVSGGAYTLDGTIGQADAGILTGGNYTLSGGYWFAATGAPPTDYFVYLPLVRK